MKPLTMVLVMGAAAVAGATAAHAQSIDVAAPVVITETEGLPRLPSEFRDCWEPLPRHCVRPPGLLWFGDAATLQHERRTFRGHRVRSAVSR